MGSEDVSHPTHEDVSRPFWARNDTAKRLGAKYTGRETSVYPENLPKREVRTNPKENTDTGQRHQYITSSFGEFKCLLFVHCVHLSICKLGQHND